MVQGSFKRLRHEHHFTDFNGGTLMIDYFNYKSPFGFLGKIADILFLEKYMTDLLKKRNTTIKEFAETGKWKKIVKD